MSWLIAALLGSYHGLNPAMGWLFATSLGLQERRAGAVLEALPPIILGHAASVAFVVGVAVGAEQVVSPGRLRYAGAALLIGGAAFLLWRGAHPRRVGMRLGMRGLFVWSFVMSSSHGAGLMLLPVLLAAGVSTHAAHLHGTGAAGAEIFAVHTGAMLLTTSTMALLSFRLADVGFLRRAWINTETIWSLALAASGLFVLIG